ncbi:hypothetical protein C8R44DRAFT_739010 [Mycena epipterygia]|nr:hypothetical protein C8R44DRAFT_739010 [Mycena epipterygia]
MTQLRGPKMTHRAKQASKQNDTPWKSREKNDTSWKLREKNNTAWNGADKKTPPHKKNGGKKTLPTKWFCSVLRCGDGKDGKAFSRLKVRKSTSPTFSFERTTTRVKLNENDTTSRRTNEMTHTGNRERETTQPGNGAERNTTHFPGSLGVSTICGWQKRGMQAKDSMKSGEQPVANFASTGAVSFFGKKNQVASQFLSKLKYMAHTGAPKLGYMAGLSGIKFNPRVTELELCTETPPSWLEEPKNLKPAHCSKPYATEMDLYCWIAASSLTGSMVGSVGTFPDPDEMARFFKSMGRGKISLQSVQPQLVLSRVRKVSPRQPATQRQKNPLRSGAPGTAFKAFSCLLNKRENALAVGIQTRLLFSTSSSRVTISIWSTSTSTTRRFPQYQSRHKHRVGIYLVALRIPKQGLGQLRRSPPCKDVEAAKVRRTSTQDLSNTISEKNERNKSSVGRILKNNVLGEGQTIADLLSSIHIVFLQKAGIAIELELVRHSVVAAWYPPDDVPSCKIMIVREDGEEKPPRREIFVMLGRSKVYLRVYEFVKWWTGLQYFRRYSLTADLGAGAR